MFIRWPVINGYREAHIKFKFHLEITDNNVNGSMNNILNKLGSFQEIII